ncbi:sn-1-specific diacylglycerol lipase ABHD11-like, partial [Saccoglossus kowalevskii]|uniref:sn-1-specific diacylglycerol lipase ABHD11 n=1 Tax=Saccoglossus kowalevskii TaxID=10224 RepID=A0ABM0MAG0_SACKO
NDGDDPPILFLHGLFGNKSNFQSIAKHINRKTQRKTITVDARNHGDSPHSDEMSYSAMTADVLALLNSLKIQKCVLTGHSMGGKVSMVTALTEPDVIDKMIVVDISPSPSARSTIDFDTYIKAMRNLQFDHSLPRSTMRKYADQQLKPSVPNSRDRLFLLTNFTEISGHYCWRVNLNAIERQLRTLYDFDHFSSTYDGPALFIGGGNSPYISPKHYPEIKRLFPRSAVTHIEGAGHWVHSEKPWQFIETLIDFLNGSLLPSQFNSRTNLENSKIEIPYMVNR